MRSTTKSVLICTGLLTCITVSTSFADSINFVSNNAESSNPNSYGGFTGSLEYNYLGSSQASLIITITNTSQFEGKLVALAFDAVTGTSSWAFNAPMSSGLSASWQGLAGSINTAPFGDRQFGASTSSSWLGGGSPNSGLLAGDTGIWEFGGTGSESVSAADFLSPNNGNNLLVRFRGFSNGASDKIPATPPGDVVPGLAGLPILAMAGLARRRRSR